MSSTLISAPYAMLFEYLDQHGIISKKHKHNPDPKPDPEPDYENEK